VFWKTSLPCCAAEVIAVNLPGILAFKIWIWWNQELISWNWYFTAHKYSYHRLLGCGALCFSNFRNDLKRSAASFFMQGDISKGPFSAFLPIYNKTSVRLLEHISLKKLSLFVQWTNFDVITSVVSGDIQEQSWRHV